MLNKERIQKELENLGIKPPKIVFYDETDSTNTQAKEYAKETNVKETVVFIANSQTGGRGRRGRSFVSNKDAGIYLSILSYPNKSGTDVTSATANVAVMLCRAIESLCNCDIKIKWVNDLYLGNKKLAGILTEGEINSDGNLSYQIVGMGINIYKNAISEEISDIATSIEDEIGSGIDRSRLVAEIIKNHMYFNKDFYSEYKNRCFVIGKDVEVLKLCEQYKAKVIDVEPDYSLLIERDGVKERLITGEISIKV